MNAAASVGTSSNTAQNVPQSSSVSPYTPYYSTPSALPPPSNDPWWKSKEFVIALLGMIFTGVIGYFSAQWALKESISNLQGQVNLLTERVSVMKPAADAVPIIQKDLAVLEVRLQAIKR